MNANVTSHTRVMSLYNIDILMYGFVDCKIKQARRAGFHSACGFVTELTQHRNMLVIVEIDTHAERCAMCHNSLLKQLTLTDSYRLVRYTTGQSGLMNITVLCLLASVEKMHFEVGS